MKGHSGKYHISNAPAVFPVLPVVLLCSIFLMNYWRKYVHSISNVRSSIAVILPTILIGGIVFIFIIVPLFLFVDFPPPQPPLVSINVLSATPTSIELRHSGGDFLRLSEMQFTVKESYGEVLRPSINNSSDSFKVGDMIRLSDSGSGFGNIGDNIEIIAEHNNVYSDRPKIEIFKTRNSNS